MALLAEAEAERKRESIDTRGERERVCVERESIDTRREGRPDDTRAPELALLVEAEAQPLLREQQLLLQVHSSQPSPRHLRASNIRYNLATPLRV